MSKDKAEFKATGRRQFPIDSNVILDEDFMAAEVLTIPSTPTFLFDIPSTSKNLPSIQTFIQMPKKVTAVKTRKKKTSRNDFNIYTNQRRLS